MCADVTKPVGPSKGPAIIDVASEPISRQNKFPPHTRKNPRSASSDDQYQDNVSSEIISSSVFLLLVAATKLPDVLRHC